MTKKENRQPRPSLERTIPVWERTLRYTSDVAINGNTATMICEVVNGTWQSTDLRAVQRKFGIVRNYEISWSGVNKTSVTNQGPNTITTYIITGRITSR